MLEKNAPEILSVDLFTDAFEQAFKVFDPNRPLVVISEGLINYFDKNL
jgi:O-methyltransferase involved in polyketide biosynthesis